MSARSGRQPHCFPSLQSGIAYIEVVIATLLITLALAPALDALQPATSGAAIIQDRLIDHYYLTGKLEDVLAQPYGVLTRAAAAAGSRSTPSSLSDSVTRADGQRLIRNVYLAQYDADNADGDNNPFSGADTELLWIRVEIPESGQALETLRSE
jgi:hypothetical protein